jgi:hypothetical protein
MGRRKATTFEEFVARAVAKHGARFEYVDDGSFASLESHILIRCHEHGQFIQRAQAHVRGAGCPRCRSELVRKNLKNGTRESERKRNPPALAPFGALGGLYTLPFWS